MWVPAREYMATNQLREETVVSNSIPPNEGGHSREAGGEEHLVLVPVKERADTCDDGGANPQYGQTIRSRTLKRVLLTASSRRLHLERRRATQERCARCL